MGVSGRRPLVQDSDLFKYIRCSTLRNQRNLMGATNGVERRFPPRRAGAVQSAVFQDKTLV